MEWFKLPRLHQLDVKWTGLHRGNHPLADYVHSNPYYEIIMVTEGPVYLELENKPLELQTGDWFLLKPWEHHTAWRRSHDQSAFFWVQFSVQPELIEASPKDLQLPLHEIIFTSSKQELRTGGEPEVEFLYIPRHTKPNRRYELLNLFEKLHYEIEHPQGYFRHRCSLILGQILHLLAEELLLQFQGPSPVPAAFTIYRQLVNYLNENYNQETNRSKVEAELNRNYEYLCQVFKRYAGMSMLTYVHHLRIQRAKHLLISTNRDIKEIAESVGFQDPYYFSRLFKRLEQCSPSEFRASLK